MSQGLVDPSGRNMQPAQSQEQAIPMFQPKDDQKVMIRVGFRDEGFTFYPDGVLTMAPGILHAEIIYWQENVLVYKVLDYRAFGVPLQYMIVPIPDWWERRKEGTLSTPY